MRTPSIAFLVLVALGGAAGAGKQVLAIKKSPDLPEGFAVTITTDMTMDFQFKTGTTTMPVTGARHTAYLIEALAVDGDHIDKAKVTYQAITDTGSMSSSGADPRSAQTYVIEPGASALHVVHGDDSEVTGDELTKVVDEFRPLFQRFPIRAVLVGRIYKKGKKVKLREEDFAELFGGERANEHVEAFAVTLRSVKKGLAVFDIACDLSLGAGTGNMTVSATGQMTIDTKRVLPLSVHLAGGISGTVEGMTASGTLDVSRTFSY